jgi:ABC-type polysaccharide transport system, permease component
MIGVQIAFKNYNLSKGIFGSPWVGLKHFKTFLTSYQFGRLMLNTLGLSIYQIVAGFFPPIILALALNYSLSRKFGKTVQMITYMPHFISTVLIVAIVSQILSINGVVNTVIKNLGAQPIQFLGEPSWFKSVYVWSGIWQGTGYNAILYLAAIAGINPELYEAATVDGASIWKRIWHIDIPGIMPTAIILLILSTGKILNIGYEKVLLLQNQLNMQSSDIISTYVYRIGLVSMQYSYSSAINLMQSFISLILIVLVNGISKKVTENSLW